MWVRDYRGCEKWSPGVVTRQTGPVSYEVNVRGQTWNRHAEQLRPGLVNEPTASSPEEQQGEESTQETTSHSKLLEQLRNQIDWLMTQLM